MAEIAFKNVARYSREEMKAEMDAVHDQYITAMTQMTYKYCSVKAARRACDFTGHGIRASDGQSGGGVYVSTVGPHDMEWERNMGGQFRATVGRELYGENAEKCLEGGEWEERLTALLVLIVPKAFLAAGAEVPGRPATSVIPGVVLPRHDDFHWLERTYIHKVYLLQPDAGRDRVRQGSIDFGVLDGKANEATGAPQEQRLEWAQPIVEFGMGLAEDDTFHELPPELTELKWGWRYKLWCQRNTSKGKSFLTVFYGPTYTEVLGRFSLRKKGRWQYSKALDAREGNKSMSTWQQREKVGRDKRNGAGWHEPQKEPEPVPAPTGIAGLIASVRKKKDLCWKVALGAMCCHLVGTKVKEGLG
eukprot:COSAG01_NODE_3508_length_5989_cov_5.088115_5_plen_361_part_00